MERITQDYTKAAFSPWEVCFMDHDCAKNCYDENHKMTCKTAKGMWKLCDYENTGLSPEEVVKLKKQVKGLIKKVSRLKRQLNDEKTLKDL